MQVNKITAMAASSHVVDVTAQTFHSVVLDGSFDRPVLVDYWADWCAPCRALAPVLAKLAADFGGKLLVAKVDTEAEHALAQQAGIRSLPTVQLYRNGQVVDQFAGALPEAQIRSFLEAHVESESDRLLARAKGLVAAGQMDQARHIVEEARASDPSNARLLITEAEIALASGDLSAAEAVLERVPIDIHDDPEVAALRGQVHFKRVIATAPDAQTLEARVLNDPKDSEARYQLAALRLLDGDYEAALNGFLQIVQRDRAYGEDAARKAMLHVFEMLGGGELVTRYRSRMLNALY